MSSIVLSGFADEINGVYHYLNDHDGYPYYLKDTEDVIIEYKLKNSNYSLSQAYWIEVIAQIPGSIPIYLPRYVAFGTNVLSAEWIAVEDNGLYDVGSIRYESSSSESSSSSVGYSSNSSKSSTSESSTSSLLISSSSISRSESSLSSLGYSSESSLGYSSESSLGYSSESSSSESDGGGGGPAPVSCPGGNPDVIITLSGDLGGSTRTFCGETWQLGGAGDESGVQKRVCPTYYNIRNSVTVLNKTVSESWNNNIAGQPTSSANNGLRFRRFFSYGSYYGSPTSDAFNLIRLITFINTAAGYASVGYGPYPNSAGRFQDPSNLYPAGFGPFSPIGVLTTGAPLPTTSDYRISDNFFGEFTSGGVTYKWERGNNW